MSGGGTTTTQTQTLDPASQRYVGQTRTMASRGAQGLQNLPGTLYSPETMSIYDQAKPFLNPWFDQVIDPVNASFDRALDMSRMNIGAGAQAGGAGAFGGARHGVAEAVGRGEIEQARGSVLGNLYNSGWQTALGQGLQYQGMQRDLALKERLDPYLRAEMGVGLRNAGMGPYGQTTSTEQKQNPNVFGQLVGLGGAIAAPWLSGLMGIGGAAAGAGAGAGGMGALTPFHTGAMTNGLGMFF